MACGEVADEPKLSLEDLRLFALMSEAGGISAAERQYGLSKARLSRALSRLEGLAEGPLFDRVGRGLALTQAGHVLLPIAQDSLRAAREAETALNAAHGVPRGPLRIAASALSAQQLLAPVIAEFGHRYPAVETSIVVTGHGPDPLAENLDVVLRLGRPEEAHLVARRVLTSPLKLYVSALREKDVDLHDPEAVAGLGRILIDVPGSPRDWTLRNASGQVLKFQQPPLVQVGDPTVALGILRAGTGVVFLPELYGRARIGSNDFVEALPGYRGPDVEIYAAFPPRRASVPAVREFMNTLGEYVLRVGRGF